jgi:hypothetical protein
MKILRLSLCLGTVLARFCATAQGTFQNLDFEQAIDVPTYPGSPFIWTTDAFPGWTVYAGGGPQTEVARDGVLYAVAALADTAPPSLVLDGNFSAILAGYGLVSVTAAIGQSGVIPAGSESLRFLSLGQLSVSFAGHSLPLQVLGNGPNASQIYGANISAYAGQYGQMLFQAGPGGIYVLDNISFSSQAIPEPGAPSILGLGALVLSLWRRKRQPVLRRCTEEAGL